MTANLLTPNSSKTEFLLIGLGKQLAKINSSSLNTTYSSRNLLLHIWWTPHFFWPDSSVSKSCYYHIRQLRCIRPYLDTKTASTIATSIVHSKVQASLLQLSLSQPAQVSDHPAPTDPKRSCTCCCQSSEIQSHHSQPTVSALAKDNWAHWLQAHLTYLQSSHNHPTITSA